MTRGVLQQLPSTPRLCSYLKYPNSLVETGSDPPQPQAQVSLTSAARLEAQTWLCSHGNRWGQCYVQKCFCAILWGWIKPFRWKHCLGPEGYCKIPCRTSTDTESQEVWFTFSLTSELLWQQHIRSPTSFPDPVYTCWIPHAVDWNASLPDALIFVPGEQRRQKDVLAFKIKCWWFVGRQKVLHPVLWTSTTAPVQPGTQGVNKILLGAYVFKSPRDVVCFCPE